MEVVSETGRVWLRGTAAENGVRGRKLDQDYVIRESIHSVNKEEQVWTRRPVRSWVNP